MADLKGKVALIDGAAQMLGAGVAAGLAEAGATLYLADHVRDGNRSEVMEKLTAAAARVDALGGQSTVHLIEARDDQALAELFVRIAGEQDRLDLLVNNVALFQPVTAVAAAFWETPVASWDDCAPLTLRDSYLCSSQAARMMVPAGAGLMVNLCVADTSGGAASLPQQALSAGVRAMMVPMARALGRRGVTTLALDPEVTPNSEVTVTEADALPRAETDVTLRPINEQAQYLGRALAALTMDPDITEKHAGCFSMSELAREYRFSPPQANGTW